MQSSPFVPAPAVRPAIATRRPLALLAALALIPGASAADNGGWLKQQIPLVEGWNLVWLEVHPTPSDPPTVFADLITGGLLESAWVFSPPVSDLGDGKWLVYDADAPAYVNTLSEVRGGRGLFLKLTAAPAQPFEVTGKPAHGERSLPAKGALIGASTAGGVSFRDYLAFGNVDDKIQSNGAIHRFDPDAVVPEDEFVEVALDEIGGLVANAAYWINLDQTFPYRGPIRVAGPVAGCQFGQSGYIDPVTIEVPVAGPGGDVVTVKAVETDAPPAGEPADAGGPDDTWLQYRDGDEWVAFPPAGVQLVIPEGEAQATIELRAQRMGLGEASPQDTGSLYQALLQISDPRGNVVVVPTGMEKPSIVGTWTGVVEITTVSLNSGVDPAPPPGADASKTMRFMVMLEIPDTGSSRLLNKACLSVARDGDTLSHAYDAILFPDTIELPGDLRTGTATGSWALGADHPLNPYRHRYNPRHRSGYEITRSITIDIDESAALDPNLDTIIVDTLRNTALLGTYTETISGLSNEAITLSGTFRLRRLSRRTGLDSLCVCGLPGAGQPWQPDGIPGCQDAACCSLVCEIDPNCCEVGWDANCVQLACANCTNPELPNQPVCNP